MLGKVRSERLCFAQRFLESVIVSHTSRKMTVFRLFFIVAMLGYIVIMKCFTVYL